MIIWNFICIFIKFLEFPLKWLSLPLHRTVLCGDSLRFPELVWRLSWRHLRYSRCRKKPFQSFPFIWLIGREWSCHKFPLWESLTPREKTDHSHRDEKLHKHTLSQTVIPSICFPKSPFALPMEAVSPSSHWPIKLVYKPLSLAIQGTSSSECSYTCVNKMCFLLLICLLSINLKAPSYKT